MTQLDTSIVESALAVHNSLWNALYDFDSDKHTLYYNDAQYNIYIGKNRGYASVNLPNLNGTQFLWITQNLNKSTYGTLQVQQARQRNEDHRITWIVDTSHGKFEYRTAIHTTSSDTGELMYGTIDMYDQYGLETVWSNDPNKITKKAKF
jgi:hypothetical protein